MPRSNLNINQGEIYREHRYINVCSSGQRLVPGAGAATDFYTTGLTDDGYPTETTFGVAFTAYFPGDGTYIVKWLGSGSVTGASISNKVDSSRGSWTGGGASGSVVTNGRFTCTVASTSSVMTVKGTTINSLVICRQDEEDAYDAGQRIRDDYIELINEFNPAAIRFMDAQAMNTSMLTHWDDRPSLSKITYRSIGAFKNAKVVGEATGTNTYSATGYDDMPGSWTHGEHFIWHAENSNDSATCTIDLGSRGAKTVHFSFGLAPITTGTNSTVRIIAGANYVGHYDSVADKVYIKPLYNDSWGDPLETLVEICNETSKPGWFCIPFYATDDFVESFADYLVANYTPSLIYFEYVNEIWNTAAGFEMTHRATTHGQTVFGLGTGNNAAMSGWYGYRFRQIMEIIRGVFTTAGQASKVKGIIAGQGSNGGSLATLRTLFEDHRIQNETVPELTGANAPYLQADYFSYALYYAGTTLKWTDAQYTAVADITPLTDAVDDYLSEDPALIEAAFDWAADDILDLTLPHTEANARFDNWNTIAAEYSKGIVVYESNQEVDAPSTAWATAAPISDASYGGQSGKINQFLVAFWASHQYHVAVRRILDAFYAYSQSEQYSLFGMCTTNPWLAFKKRSPLTETTLGGDTTQDAYQNWHAHAKKNNGLRRMRLRVS